MDRPAALPLIELDNASVVLSGKTVLDTVSWQLRSGEHWLVSGANGAGKTTLLRVIRGDQPIIYGSGRRTYRLFGEDDSLSLVKPLIGYLAPEFHERLLRMELPLTARELILGGLRGTLYLSEPPTREERERVAELGETLELAPILDEPMTELSFGQLRRALLARALVKKPRVLVLDEFAHGIDRHSRRLIQGAIMQAAASGASIVVATHRREELPVAITHELQLERGRSVRQAPLSHAPRRAASLLSRNGTLDTDEESDGAVIVRIEDVDVYQDHRRILQGINWEIREGEHWLVSGPNGAGKTTLAKLLFGRLRAAYGGKIERYGSHENLSVAEIRRGVALISDDEQLRYDWSIPVEAVVASGFYGSVGLLQTPSGEQMQVVRRLLEDFGIEHLRSQKFLELSFGQRRLVLLARSLVRKPRLLILDEALNGLDHDVRLRVFRRMESLAAEGSSVVIIGHHESDIPEWIENELHLDAGRISAIGRRVVRD